MVRRLIRLHDQLNDLDEFNVGAVTDNNATANTIAENSVNGPW